MICGKKTWRQSLAPKYPLRNPAQEARPQQGAHREVKRAIPRFAGSFLLRYPPAAGGIWRFFYSAFIQVYEFVSLTERSDLAAANCRGDSPKCRKQVAFCWAGYEAYLPRTRSIPEKSNSNF